MRIVDRAVTLGDLILLWVCVCDAWPQAYLTLGPQRSNKVMQNSEHVGGRVPALSEMKVREIRLGECIILEWKMSIYSETKMK